MMRMRFPDWMRMNYIERCLALVVLIAVLGIILVNAAWGMTWPFYAFLVVLIPLCTYLFIILVKLGGERVR